jgi:hypothetical protein
VIVQNKELNLKYKYVETSTITIPAVNNYYSQGNAFTITLWFQVKLLRSNIRLVSINDFYMDLLDLSYLYCDWKTSTVSSAFKGWPIEKLRWSFALCTVQFSSNNIMVYYNEKNTMTTFTSNGQIKPIHHMKRYL